MKIKYDLLERLSALVREAYPNEVGGILLGKDVIRDFLVVPARFSESSVYIYRDMIPIYTDFIGTFHSHPSGILIPSKEDLKFFSHFGKVHLILSMNSFRAFDSEGKEVRLEVVE